MEKATNFILFQCLWVASVLGAAHQTYFWAWGVLIALIGLSLYKPKSQDLSLLIILVIAGFIFDSFLSFKQWVKYEPYLFSSSLAPAWIVFLWVGFSLSINRSMKWLIDHKAVGYVFMMVGGPLSYLAAERMGAIEITNLLMTLIFLSLTWGLLLYVLQMMSSSKMESNYAN